MTTPLRSWSRDRLGDDEVLVGEGAGARFVFGLGPAAPAEPPAERMAAALDALSPEVHAVRWCQQVHGSVSASLASEPDSLLDGAGCVGRCDGLLTDEAGLALVVWSADCVPVLLAGGGVVAAVHAGWRGAAAGVVGAVVRRFAAEYGVAPHDLVAYLGPAVEACHYPVGTEVVAALLATGVAARRWQRGDRVDVRGFVAAELERSGVPPEHVGRVAGCTACDPALASYRRDGSRAGRQWSLVVLAG